MSSWYWYHNDAFHSFISSNGEFDFGSVSDSYGVRPVISLKAGTSFNSGSGTVSDPYIVSTS